MKKFRSLEIIQEEMCCEESDYFLVNVIITFFLSLLVPIVGVLTFCYVLILYPINLIFNLFDYLYKKVRKKRYLNKCNKILEDYETDLIKNFDHLKLMNRYKDPVKVSSNAELKSFIYDFFNYYNDSNYTYDKNGLYQCDPNRRRSLGDIFLICRVYYPNVKLIDVLKVLFIFIKNKSINISKCGDIHKFVFYVNGRRATAMDEIVEFNNEITMKELYELYG